MLAGQMIDAQSRLNVNGMVQGGQPVLEQVAAFRKLLGLLELPESLADAVLVRVLASLPRTQDGKVILPTALPLLRLADLMTIPGFDATAIEKLAPFAIVLPKPTPVNLNTAAPEVIAAVIPELDLTGARRFVAKRERTFFRQLGDASVLLDGQPVLPPSMLSVGSGYFIVRGVIRFDRVEATSETLLERSIDRVDIVWQQRY
jgi:general secretion pathway protein K